MLNQTWETEWCCRENCQVLILFCSPTLDRTHHWIGYLYVHSMSTSVQGEHILFFVIGHLSGQEVTILPTSLSTVCPARKLVFFFVMVFFIMCNKSSLIKLVRSWASPYWLIISPFSNTVFLGLSRTPLQIMSAKEATCCVPVYKICKKNITCSACAFYILM